MLLLSFCQEPNCYKHRDNWYNGSVSVTRSGRTCQAWASLYPHSHGFSEIMYPELHNGENFCRNPGAEDEMPWCFTTDVNVRTERCHVPRCGKFDA